MTAATSGPATGRPLFPMVRFGRSREEGGVSQDPILYSVHDSIPADATFASPIYLLERDQRTRLNQFKENPYAVTGSSIANELQDQCQKTGMVLHPIHVESDTLTTDGNGVAPQTVVGWFRDFIEHELKVSPQSCRFFHSGGRSIHAHVPRVGTEADIEVLRHRAGAFNESRETELDAQIYTKKRQFRLPGIEHDSTGIPKFEIGAFDTDDAIARAYIAARSSPPKTYAEVLEQVFRVTPPEEVIIVAGEGVQQIAVKLLCDDVLLSLPEFEVPVSIPELALPPADDAEREVWDRYNEKEFSPYANAGEGNPRSVAVVTVRGGPFCQVTGDQRIRVPCEIHAAIGCDGQFIVYFDDRPLQISKRDLQHWEYTDGEKLVIIGGRSRRALVRRIPSEIAVGVSLRLRITKDGFRRQAAIEYLQDEGFDTGKEGPGSGGAANRFANTGIGRNQSTRAIQLKEQVERDGINSVEHIDRRSIAMSLLSIEGWDATWEWFATQFGDDHKPAIHYRQLKS